MALSGYDLAEAYVMLKQQKQKQKVEEERERASRSAIIGSPVKSSTGCFFCFSKKKSKSTSQIVDCTRKQKSATWDTS